MTQTHRIAAADAPLTIGGVPPGYLPRLMADLAGAAHRRQARAVFIASDDMAGTMVLDAAPFFAEGLETVWLPAWDSLPYDRASPSLRISADRVAALATLTRAPGRPQLVVTTVNALIQRTLKPDRIGGSVTRLAAGERIEPTALAERLAANGFTRTDAVLEPGEFAVRGGLVDFFPGGRDHGLRLDFFGDEIETMRDFDPGTQRTVGDAAPFELRPVSEILFSDDAVARFRKSYVDRFGGEAINDPLYQAVSERRRLAGTENWLPLFEEELGSIFHLFTGDDIVIADGGCAAAAAERFEAIEDYYDNRLKALEKAAGNYRPLPPDALYLTRKEWDAARKEAPVHSVSAFSRPDEEAVDLGVQVARNFAPERKSNDSVYKALGSACRDAAPGRPPCRAGQLHPRRARSPARSA